MEKTKAIVLSLLVSAVLTVTAGAETPYYYQLQQNIQGAAPAAPPPVLPPGPQIQVKPEEKPKEPVIEKNKKTVKKTDSKAEVKKEAAQEVQTEAVPVVKPEKETKKKKSRKQPPEHKKVPMQIGVVTDGFNCDSQVRAVTSRLESAVAVSQSQQQMISGQESALRKAVEDIDRLSKALKDTEEEVVNLKSGKNTLAASHQLIKKHIDLQTRKLHEEIQGIETTLQNVMERVKQQKVTIDGLGEIGASVNVNVQVETPVHIAPR